MAGELDELETAGLEARQDIAERRSKYPDILSNIFRKTLKCDVKTSMIFEVDTGMKKSNLAQFDYELLQEHVTSDRRSLSYEKLGKLEEDLNQVTNALKIISKNRPKKMFLGDQNSV